ncbi:hypothetical protein CK203_054759 [Vitis vinifera]|uniref:Uncharacterized protein n=1 Tax=Vitis vinifera TaxID=29760 RepID=A0A438GIR1_VITVI|nr:hypothetical protein CK203_054759 [Vitis vinifera]
MSTLFLVALMALAIVQNSAMSDDFNQLFQPNWAPDHISTEGDQIKLTLDTISGYRVHLIYAASPLPASPHYIKMACELEVKTTSP